MAIITVETKEQQLKFNCDELFSIEFFSNKFNSKCWPFINYKSSVYNGKDSKYNSINWAENTKRHIPRQKR